MPAITEQEGVKNEEQIRKKKGRDDARPSPTGRLKMKSHFQECI